jgi:predicted RNA-binding Zn-ribbon protein involved in translation (DUF1610 family)
MQIHFNKRSRKYLTWAIIFGFLLFSVIYTAINANDGKSNYGLSIVILLFAVLICVGYIILHLPVVKGILGEKWVTLFINKAKNKEDVLINDIIVPGEDGKTSQIDHILVSKKGLFVIETKNMAGRIYGRQDELKWMQALNYGKTKNSFYSPIRQNQTHIYRLKNIVGEETPMFNCVVFVQGNTDYIQAEVYSPYRFYKALKKTPNTSLTSEQVKTISDKILIYKDKPIQTLGEHVQEIKVTQEKIAENICPRCGGKLVLRHSKDGRAFYGCSNYPKCKFTKKAD